MSRSIVSTEVVHARGDETIIKDCHRIRVQVFHVEQGFPLETEFDAVEDVAEHFLVRVTEQDPVSGERSVKSVGTIRGTTPDVHHLLYPDVDPATLTRRYKLSRLAVDKDYREHRFGRLLVESLNKWVEEHAKSTRLPAQVECHSQVPVIPFYRKMGYVEEGDLFDEDGAPHQNMILYIPLATA
ncbi:acyl-CoA N-acyltransferase [Roridomyces roridus]|uniref:Acyl-CoA N-acyltransferase n=1 Tax=Roridomyces roridus TaxID=1738132 RepID=A0AAD7C6Z5_9AGAR|nr:acyl-CoA N-acyltransferase [Roridomyces roridus]